MLAGSQSQVESQLQAEAKCKQEANCWYVSKKTVAEKRFIYILLDGDFIRTKTWAQRLIIHISRQNSPYDMKTAVLAYVNVQ